jgi:hypothetical protein
MPRRRKLKTKRSTRSPALSGLGAKRDVRDAER